MISASAIFSAISTMLQCLFALATDVYGNFQHDFFPVKNTACTGIGCFTTLRGYVFASVKHLHNPRLISLSTDVINGHRLKFYHCLLVSAHAAIYCLPVPLYGFRGSTAVSALRLWFSSTPAHTWPFFSEFSLAVITSGILRFFKTCGCHVLICPLLSLAW